MAHLRSSILYPPPGHPHHLVPPPIVATNRSSSASNPAAPRRRHGSDSSTAAAGALLQQGDRVRYNNPSVFFDLNPKIEQPAPSGFVADAIIGRFDLNQPPDGGGHDHYMEHDDGEAHFVVVEDSAASGNASNVAQNFAEEADEDVCSQPVVPYVSMVFDTLEVAQQVYNDYAFKLGFGTRIGNTKLSTSRGAVKHTILSRVFECVHQGKPADKGKCERIMTGVGEKGQDGTIDMSCFSAQKSRSKQGRGRGEGEDGEANLSKLRRPPLPEAVAGVERVALPSPPCSPASPPPFLTAGRRDGSGLLSVAANPGGEKKGSTRWRRGTRETVHSRAIQRRPSRCHPPRGMVSFS